MAAPLPLRSGEADRAQLRAWLAAAFAEEPGGGDASAKQLLRGLGLFLVSEDFCQSGSVRYSARDYCCNTFLKLHFPDLAPLPKLKDLVAR